MIPGAEPNSLRRSGAEKVHGRTSSASCWWSTASRFEAPRNAPEDGANHVENRLNHPNEPGEVWVWVVLRDEWGGVETRVPVMDVQRAPPP